LPNNLSDYCKSKKSYFYC